MTDKWKLCPDKLSYLDQTHVILNPALILTVLTTKSKLKSTGEAGLWSYFFYCTKSSLRDATILNTFGFPAYAWTCRSMVKGSVASKHC